MCKTSIFELKLNRMIGRYFFLSIFFLLIIFMPCKAQHLSPEATVSILTCNPGTELYSIYGHTAIRVADPSKGLDVVYNYGVFSFDSPDFIYRFAKGQTDYLMIGERFRSWFPEYQKDKRSVYEQVLNLSPEGKNTLFQALVENARPQNRKYRYNFFIDNCATRVRDMIEHNVGAPVRFSSNEIARKSYRQLIKEFHHSIRWADLGIDLLVGKKADEPVPAYGQMFLPEYLKDQFARAQITLDGKEQPLVLETRTLLEFPNSKQNTSFSWPLLIFGLLALLVAALSVLAYLKKRKTDWLDYSLLAVSGLAGLIILWFTLFSEHPAMSPNYNLLWAFPLNLFFVGIWAVKKWRPKTRYYFWLSGGLLLFVFVCGQTFNPAVYFLIITLLIRVVVHLAPGKKIYT
jgi:hypothetical protein